MPTCKQVNWSLKISGSSSYQSSLLGALSQQKLQNDHLEHNFLYHLHRPRRNKLLVCPEHNQSVPGRENRLSQVNLANHNERFPNIDHLFQPRGSFRIRKRFQHCLIASISNLLKGRTKLMILMASCFHACPGTDNFGSKTIL